MTDLMNRLVEQPPLDCPRSNGTSVRQIDIEPIGEDIEVCATIHVNDCPVNEAACISPTAYEGGYDTPVDSDASEGPLAQPTRYLSRMFFAALRSAF